MFLLNQICECIKNSDGALPREETLSSVLSDIFALTLVSVAYPQTLHMSVLNFAVDVGLVQSCFLLTE